MEKVWIRTFYVIICKTVVSKDVEFTRCVIVFYVVHSVLHSILNGIQCMVKNGYQSVLVKIRFYYYFYDDDDECREQ